MRVLIVANHNTGSYAPFIVEQVNALRNLGVEIDYFGVRGKGAFGYLTNFTPLKTKIRKYNPDLLHAHYGLSGLLANMQREVPVVTTYHGSDVHSRGQNLFLSSVAMTFSAYNIFVSEGLQKTANHNGQKQCVQPCGVDTNTFCQIDRLEARNNLKWDINANIVLFAGAFDNDVKNSPLAKVAVALVPDAHLMEMRGYTREQVNWAMNAANCLLVTSHREGSPQVVKEALTCGTPIVSVDVGDVKEMTNGIEGCFITTRDAENIANALKQAIVFQGKTSGPQRIVERNLSNEFVARRILEIYQKVIKQSK